MSKTFKEKIDKLVTTGSLSDLNPSFLILHVNAARKKWGAVDMYQDRGDSKEILSCSKCLISLKLTLSAL